MDALSTVVAGGAFTILGVLIGWGLNEISTARRARPALCFKLNATPSDELTDPELRTKTSASDYCIEIYNTGQTPFILEGFELYWKREILINCPSYEQDMAIMPFHCKTYILTQQDADALARHCKAKDIKKCKIVAVAVNGKRVRSQLDISWIHMRASLNAADSVIIDND